MSNIKICRICLNTEAKLYKYDLYELKEYYEQVMATKVDENEGLSCHFCYECAALLHKFHKFKEKCHNGQRVLRNIMQYKEPITISSLLKLRDLEHLESSLDIIAINNRTRVRTYAVKSNKIPKLVKKEDVEIPDLETASLSDNGDYVDKCEEKEEIPLLPELVDFEKKIDGDDHNAINVFDPKIEDTDENTAIDVEIIKNDDDDNVKYEYEKVALEDNLNEDKIINKDDDSFICDDEENVFADELKLSDEDVFVEKVTVKKKKTKTKGSKTKKKGKDTPAKKFKQNYTKKTEIDPKNWLKIILNEDEAVVEFKARSTHKRYVSAQYKCTMCFKGFSKEDMLDRHLKLRHSESIGAIECRFCQMRFKWKCHLTKHMRQHYNKFQCLRCDLVCPLETTALFHEEYHNGVIRRCAHCGEEFKHLTTYYTHLRTHRSKYVCTLCGASFVSTVGLQIHKRIKHLIVADLEVTAPVTSQDEEVFCARCDIRFDTRKAYEEHLIQSALHVDGIEDQDVQTSLGIAKLRKNRVNQARLRRLPTDCYLCGKHFPTQSACRRHHMAEHPRRSFFAPAERQICEICGVSLAPTSVASHLNTHTKEKLYTCATCGKVFNSKSGLNTHQLTHSSVKPVACTLCDKRFKQSSSMNLHYRTFHLKEPYPKRNRKKKSEDSKLGDYPQEDSDDNLTLDRWR